MTAGPGGGAPDVLVVDARGLRCPLPVLRLAAAVRDLPPGTRAAVLATDPAVVHDVPAWAGMRGHTVESVGPVDDAGAKADGRTDAAGYRVLVRLGP
ncbi:sulfurtransferase TusA family protein [Aquipuribacter sp. SD81]|uniref:sulfurtransferase TusA family protein n=1 Tax=Aquipuribacter sp. SD81 TaxID=3127703 RepID=UPI00301B2BD6